MKFKSRKTGEVLYVADSQAKTIRHMIMTGRYEVLHNDEWNESDHPRAPNGQFGSGGGKSRDFGSEVKQHESKIAELESRLKTEEPNSSQHERTKSAIRDLKRHINSIKKVSREKSPEVEARESAHVTHTKRLNNIKSGIVEHMESIAQSKGEDPDGYFDKSEFNDIIKDIEGGNEPSWMDLSSASKEERSQLVSRLKSYFE